MGCVLLSLGFDRIRGRQRVGREPDGSTSGLNSDMAEDNRIYIDPVCEMEVREGGEVAMAFSSINVVTNSLRLKRTRVQVWVQAPVLPCVLKPAAI